MARAKLLAEVIAFLHDLHSRIEWKDLHEVIDSLAETRSIDWWLPFSSCIALGSPAYRAIPASAAILASQSAIILVDDILDADPTGMHNRVGPGRAANLAMALESTAFECLIQPQVPFDFIRPALAALSRMHKTTSLGQSQDVGEIHSEADYWRVVRNKSTPFYGLALELGAYAAEAHQELVDFMYDLGIIVGEIVQLHDDLFDALNVPARPDWNRKTNNLLILYAMSVDHDEKSEFLSKLERAHEQITLERLQEILVTSGAASYCAYQLAKRHDRTLEMVQTAGLPQPMTLIELIQDQIQPLRAILESAGAELPPDLQAHE